MQDNIFITNVSVTWNRFTNDAVLSRDDSSSMITLRNCSLNLQPSDRLSCSTINLINEDCTSDRECTIKSNWKHFCSRNLRTFALHFLSFSLSLSLSLCFYLFLDDVQSYINFTAAILNFHLARFYFHRLRLLIIERASDSIPRNRGHVTLRSEGMKGDRRMALKYVGNNGAKSNEKSFAKVRLAYWRNHDEKCTEFNSKNLIPREVLLIDTPPSLFHTHTQFNILASSLRTNASVSTFRSTP